MQSHALAKFLLSLPDLEVFDIGEKDVTVSQVPDSQHPDYRPFEEDIPKETDPEEEKAAINAWFATVPKKTVITLGNF